LLRGTGQISNEGQTLLFSFWIFCQRKGADDFNGGCLGEKHHLAAIKIYENLQKQKP
jgi:hypothetical protein